MRRKVRIIRVFKDYGMKELKFSLSVKNGVPAVGTHILNGTNKKFAKKCQFGDVTVVRSASWGRRSKNSTLGRTLNYISDINWHHFWKTVEKLESGSDLK